MPSNLQNTETHRLSSARIEIPPWQTGPRYYDRVVQAIGDNERIRLRRYIDQMDLAYAACDLVVARAGASTCSELMTTGTPSILVPSPNVAEDHQTRNAESLVSANAAAS